MEYLSTLDDKGRISLPVRIRESINVSHIILTKGYPKSVWVFLPVEWEAFSQNLLKSANQSFTEQLKIQRQFFAPKVEIEIDKAGRIPISQSLRDFAGLSHDCRILEVVNHLEIWDSEQYRAYEEANEAEIQEVLEKMGPAALFSGSQS